MIKRLLFFLLVLSLHGMGFASEEIETKCDTCDLKSVSLSGPTMHQCRVGLTNTVIYCTKCKNFVSIETGFSLSEENEKAVDFEELKRIERGIFESAYIGDEPFFMCPKCGGRGCIYNEDKCPKCSKGVLRREVVAEVD